MFISSSTYRKEIEKLIKKSTTLSLAVAFWGKDSESLFIQFPNVKMRIICNLLSGGTNPEPIKKLIGCKNIQIRRLDNLHAKVIVNDISAIIGSANLSTNGLNHENDEDPGWIEAGVAIDVPGEIKSVTEWFEYQWSLSKEITKDDLNTAQKNWDKRRRTRISNPSARSFFDLPASSLRDTPVFIAFYTEDASSEANKAFGKVKESPEKLIDNKKLSFFEQWDELPIDSSIVSVCIGPRGGAEIEGVYRRLPSLDRKYKIGNESHKIQVVIKENYILNFPFSLAEQNKLKKLIAHRIKKYHHEERDNAICISLYHALQT